MGFSVTAAHIIIFIASVAVAAGVAGVVSSTADLLQAGVLEKSKQTSDKLLTGVEIVHVYPTSQNTSIYVLNTGKEVLNPNATGVFVDGEWRAGNITIVNRSTNIQNSFWDPLEVIKINTTAVSSGKHRAKVVVEGGVEDEYLFSR